MLKSYPEDLKLRALFTSFKNLKLNLLKAKTQIKYCLTVLFPEAERF
jgi:hypothetical protein